MKVDNIRLFEYPVRSIAVGLIIVAFLLPACARLAPPDINPAKEAESKKEITSLKDDESPRDSYENFALASIAIQHGRYEEARKYLSQAISGDPDSLYLCRKMALLLKELKQYENALTYATRCVELDSKDISSRVLLGDLYALIDDDASALEQYGMALKQDPDDDRIRLLLTTIYIRKGQFTQAMEHLKILTDKDSGLVIAWYYRGRINLELGNYIDAEKELLHALSLNKGLEPALFDLGTLYQMTGRRLDAVKVYEKLLSARPDNMVVRERLLSLYFSLGFEEKAQEQMQEIKDRSGPGERGRRAIGLIYLKQGKIDESIEELKMIVAAWPEDDKSRYYLANAYEEKGDAEKAIEHFRKIKQQSKYYINAQMHLAYLMDASDDHDGAIKILEKALALDEDRAEIYLMLASVYETKKEYTKAMAVLRQGLKHDSENIEFMFRLGVLMDKNGDKDACIAQMRKILAIDPDNAEALNYIGYTYAEQGIRLDEAMSMIKKALEIKPESGYIMDSLGWVYFQKGQYDEAIHYIEKAMALTPDDPTITEHLGDAYLKKKKYRQALETYRQALRLNHPDNENLKKKILEVESLLNN